MIKLDESMLGLILGGKTSYLSGSEKKTAWRKLVSTSIELCAADSKKVKHVPALQALEDLLEADKSSTYQGGYSITAVAAAMSDRDMTEAVEDAVKLLLYRGLRAPATLIEKKIEEQKIAEAEAKTVA